MRVLVMGGTQFNGLALVHELVRAGHEVTVCNRGRSEADLPEGVTRLVADRTDADEVRKVLGGTEWDCVQDMTAYHPPDVELMIELFDGSVGHYIFASSTVVYAASDTLPITEDHPDERGPDQNEYGLHKLLCEDLIVAAHETTGFPGTTVPFSMVFGPHNTIRDREQRMFARLLAGRPVLCPGDGSTLLQVGHVEDQARALESLMGRSATFGRRYNLTGAQAVSRRGYISTISEIIGVEPDVVTIPAELMDDLWTGQLSVGDAQTDIGMNIRSSSKATSNPRADMLRRRFQIAQLVQHLAPNIHWWNQSTMFSIDRLRDETGWAPTYDFAGAAEQTYEWFRSAGLDTGVERDWTFEDQLLTRLRP